MYLYSDIRAPRTGSFTRGNQMFSRQRLSSGLMVFIFLTVSAYPQLITGSASMKLSGPVTRDVTDQGRKSANVKLKTELLLWLQDNSGLALDTTNALDNYHFDLFVTACIKKGKEESSFKGSNWTITYSIPAQNVGEALTDFNGENDSLAVVFWNRCKTSMENKNYASAYVEGVKALGYACAHFGPPSQTPGMTGHDLIDDVRNTAQDLFNRIQVKSSDMVIKGKAGLVPENPPIITLTADSTPLAGITFTASLPSGRELFTTISGDNGEVSLDNMKIQQSFAVSACKAFAERERHHDTHNKQK